MERAVRYRTHPPKSKTSGYSALAGRGNVMSFEVSAHPQGWRIQNGAVTFGPYSTREKAVDAASNLNRQERWFDLEPAELVERQAHGALERSQ